MSDAHFLRHALRLARRGCGLTSPNPMVGAILVKGTKIIGHGWHRRAGLPHAEIEALRDAEKHGHSPRGAILYVTLEPCCTHGRTPPCTDAIIAAGIRRIVVGATDPNPKHAGKGFTILKRAGVEVVALAQEKGRARCPQRAANVATLPQRENPSANRTTTPRRAGTAPPYQSLADECVQLNKAFNHWIVHRTPFVTAKAAMTLDGKIATARGESKWITGEKSRAVGMELRRGADAILVGVNTILADNPSLTRRMKVEGGRMNETPLRRIVLDAMGRTPLNARVVSDAHAAQTTIVVSRRAPKRRVAALAERVRVLVAPAAKSLIDLRWLLKRLGREDVIHLLVEGGGEVNASFLLGGLAQRVVFFYAPKILGGRDARRSVAGDGARGWGEVLELNDVTWHRVGPDLWLEAAVG